MSDPAPLPSVDPDPEVARALHLTRGPARWPWIVALLVVLGVAGWAVIGARTADAPGRWDYQTGEAIRGDLTVRVTAVGQLQPRNTVRISSELSGIIGSVDVELDQRVAAGQLLATLDASVLHAQKRQSDAAVAAAKAGLQQAKVNLSAAERELTRSRAVAKQGAVTAVSLEQAETAVAAAQASVALAQAQLAQARAAAKVTKTQLAKTVIRSPIDGVVLERNVEPGQAVVSALQAATLFVVAEDLAQMEVEVEIDEADIGRLAPQQVAEFTVAAHPERVFEATVRTVHLAPKPQMGVVTYVAELDAPNTDGALRPGMTATARIDTTTLTDVLLLPNGALRWSPEDDDSPAPAARDGRRVARVWILDGDTPEPREVLPGVSDGRHTVIEPGDVRPGEDVIIDATDRRARGR